MIMAKPGEVVLNEAQQSALGGAGTFKKIGVPGFATGGVVPITPPQPGGGQVDMAMIGAMIANGISTLKVIQNVNELNTAQDELKVINSTTEL